MRATAEVRDVHNIEEGAFGVTDIGSAVYIGASADCAIAVAS